MGMTMVEKILAAHAGKEEVQAGELVMARVDLALANDVTAPVAIDEFRKIGVERVFDRERVVLVLDHFTPNKDIRAAAQCQKVRRFALEQDLPYYYEGGRVGIEHCLLPEEGLVGPGDLVVGADSHTCTYGALGALATGVGSTDLAAAMALGEAWFKVPATLRFELRGKTLPRWVTGKDLILRIIGDIGVDGARYRAMEFGGEGLAALSMAGRFTVANMAIEAGGKCGLFPVDEQTRQYLQGRLRRPYQVYQSDPDAVYERVYTYDLEELEPVVAFPHLPENVRPVREVPEIPIDQVVIGSCTNGRLEDLRLAADVLRGHRAHPRVRLLIFPGTPAIYRQAIQEGLIEVFLDAGAVISPPTCGPCLGGHLGILAAGERAVATTNRNFVGRMGDPSSEVYLANPAVAAASAVLGRLAHPDEV